MPMLQRRRLDSGHGKNSLLGWGGVLVMTCCSLVFLLVVAWSCNFLKSCMSAFNLQPESLQEGRANVLRLLIPAGPKYRSVSPVDGKMLLAGLKVDKWG